MTPEQWAMIKTYCRDQAAYEALQQILMVEFEMRDHQAQQAVAQTERQLLQHQALEQVIGSIRASLDLETLFRSTASQVQSLLQADRVGMFRFQPGSGWDDGEFVSEAVHPDYPSAMAAKVHDHCFGDQFAVHYHKGRIQAVADIYTAGLSDCHIEILAQFHIRANLAVPLLQGSNLWGLLCIHQCRGPRQWQDREIAFVRQIADHLGVALQQAELLQDLQSEIEERQQAERRLQRLNQDLSRSVSELTTLNDELESFSYSVSHDLRAPLRSINGFSQALLEDYHHQLDETAQDYLCRIQAAANRMGHLIDDMLDLSRVIRSELYPETVDLSELAHSILAELHQREPERHVMIQVQSGLTAFGDLRLLRILLINLLENAWKFTSKRLQSQIEFGAMVHEDRGLVHFVRDNGAGFDMAFVHKLFHPFQRLHPGHEFPGNGIGLATVLRIVQRHYGQIWAEAMMDQGATFYFTLGNLGSVGNAHESSLPQPEAGSSNPPTGSRHE